MPEKEKKEGLIDQMIRLIEKDVLMSKRKLNPDERMIAVAAIHGAFGALMEMKSMHPIERIAAELQIATQVTSPEILAKLRAFHAVYCDGKACDALPALHSSPEVLASQNELHEIAKNAHASIGRKIDAINEAGESPEAFSERMSELQKNELKNQTAEMQERESDVTLH